MLMPLRYIEAFGPYYVFDVLFNYFAFKEIQKGVKEGHIRTRADKMFFFGVWLYGVVIITVIPILMLILF